MIITKMALPRTDVPARDGGGASRCRCWTRWCRRSPRRHGAEARAADGLLLRAERHLPAELPSGGVGTNFEFTPVLKPLEPLREHIVVVSGLANKGAENLSEGGGVHTRVGTSWLSGMRPKKTEGADIEAGTSIDQMAAPVIGQDTPLNSLQLALDYDFVVGSCENGYSCVYQRTFSWKTPTTPMPMESNPRAVFERLFGEGGDRGRALRADAQDRSVLDLGDGGHGAADAARSASAIASTVDEYLTAVRDVEQRIQRAETQTADEPAARGRSSRSASPMRSTNTRKLMFDLKLLAFQADVTRVVAFQISRELSGRPIRGLACPTAITPCRTTSSTRRRSPRRRRSTPTTCRSSRACSRR